jgi:hypothetical protein
MQSHGITLAFHREVADSSRELVGPDITAAAILERYPRFIKCGFQDYEGVGIKRSTAGSKHVPSGLKALPSNEPERLCGYVVLSRPITMNRSPRLSAAHPIPQRLTNARDPNGRACCDTLRSTNRPLSRLPRSFSARAASTNVLTDLPAASGEAVVAETLNSSWR